MRTWAIFNESFKRYWNDLTDSWVETADAAVLYVEPDAAHEEARRLLKSDGSMQLKIVEVLPAELRRVNRSQVEEDSAHEFSVEASQLGWPPGYWPTVLATDLGNGQNLVLISVASISEASVYQQAAGCVTLTVFND